MHAQIKDQCDFENDALAGSSTGTMLINFGILWCIHAQHISAEIFIVLTWNCSG
jgi:hypothetical protein